MSAVNQRGREREGPPEIIQKFRLRNWPISSADVLMTPMEGTEHHSGLFLKKDFGAISGGPLFSRPLCFTADHVLPFPGGTRKHIKNKIPRKSQEKTRTVLGCTSRDNCLLFSSKPKGLGEEGAAKRAKMVLCPFHTSHREICTRNRPVSEAKFLDDFWRPLSLPAPLFYCWIVFHFQPDCCRYKTGFF